MFYSIQLINGYEVIRFIAGFVLIIVSGTIAAIALTIMRKKETDITFRNQTTTFITEGSFKYSRNPLYLSLLMVLASIALFINTAWLIISLIILFLLYNYGAVGREERYLEEVFDKEYLMYKRKVRRWI
jgi:protein-S-isoprenylcysteine O-methyltransferase Ste14